MRALTRDPQLAGHVSDRPTMDPDPLDQQPPAVRRQTSVSVRHEDLRMVKTSDISTTPEVLPSEQAPVSNLLAKYNSVHLSHLLVGQDLEMQARAHHVVVQGVGRPIEKFDH